MARAPGVARLVRRLEGAYRVHVSSLRDLLSQYHSVRGFHQYGPQFREFEATAEDLERARHSLTGDLSQLYFAHDGRLVTKWLQYLPAYERHFARFRPGGDWPVPLRFLEIGVSHGGSLQLWRRYFGSEAIIFGVDVDPKCKAVDDPDLEVRIGSQADAAFLTDVVAEMGGVDIVLDDGSHAAPHQQASFEALFPLLADGGVYAVEDLHSSYWRRFGGGYRRRAGFIEFAKDLVDGMHGWHYKHAPPRRATFAKTDVTEVCFHDSVVFIEKRLHHAPQVIKLGHPSF